MDSEAKKEFAIYRAGVIIGGIIGLFIGIALGLLAGLGVTKDDAKMWRSFRADGLNNGSLEYTYDEEGHPIIRWKEGAEIDSTTTRSAEPKSENAQGVR